MHHEDWDLQLLAEEVNERDPAGVIPEGAVTTEAEPSPAPAEALPPRAEGDAGLTEELLRRGVPREKLERHRKALERAGARAATGRQPGVGAQAAPVKTPEDGPSSNGTGNESTSSAAGAAPSPQGEGNESQAGAKDAPAKLTLEQLLADPESRKILHDYANGIVRERVKNTGRDAAAYRALAPALEALAEKHGMIGGDPDPEELSRRILAEVRLRSAGTGAPDRPAGPPAPRIDPRREALFRAHFGDLRRQEAELRKDYPGFDLGEALRDPAFARMVAPGSPLGLEDAYFATHRQEILADREQQIRQRALEEASRALRAGQQRPRESSGSRGNTASPSLSREQREDLKRRIHAAAARGEKIYPT